MDLAARILHAITDPNVAYVLFSLALIGLAAELYHPGLIVPGVAGGVCLILALVAFGNLPVNWGGVLLIAMGLALLAADALSAGIGFLALGGAVVLLLGSLFFYRPFGPVEPSMPRVSVSPWLIGGTMALALAFSGLVLRALWRLRGQPPRSGPEVLLGQPGVALAPLEPGRSGRVRVAGETWTAQVEGEAVRTGEPVRVAGVEGVTLTVRREEETP